MKEGMLNAVYLVCRVALVVLALAIIASSLILAGAVLAYGDQLYGDPAIDVYDPALGIVELVGLPSLAQDLRLAQGLHHAQAGGN